MKNFIEVTGQSITDGKQSGETKKYLVNMDNVIHIGESRGGGAAITFISPGNNPSSIACDESFQTMKRYTRGLEPLPDYSTKVRPGASLDQHN